MNVNARLSSLAFLGLILAGCGNGREVQTVQQTNCQVVWSNRGTSAGRYDVYILDMPQDQWVSGTITLDASVPGQERTAIFYDEMDVAQSSWASRAIATQGSVTITVAGTATGDSVTVQDTGAHSYFDLDADGNVGAQSGDGGASNFTGVWSATGDLTPGNGSVALNYHGLAETIGTGNANAPLEYALCYQFDTMN